MRYEFALRSALKTPTTRFLNLVRMNSETVDQIEQQIVLSHVTNSLQMSYFLDSFLAILPLRRHRVTAALMSFCRSSIVLLLFH
jgi:hypothetical protein